ncbi:hypothetical protein [Georgenia alba]|uniref:PH domain-containing protein n=1 Tax=Georgenia alba TaxID=2233858 RepID=A0ABW2Q823_9MICO
MPESSITVTLDKRLAPVFAAVGAALGLACSLAVGPVVGWLLRTVDGAPAPLRLIDQLPLVWAMPLLTVVGLVGGWIVFGIWGEEVGQVTVDAQDVVLTSGKRRATYARAEIAGIFLDKDELVLLDHQSHELSRTRSDSGLAGRLERAFGQFGYPWMGTTDPHDARFTTWVDRSRDLEPRAHELLRGRARALADKRPGAAEEAREELMRMGVVVRDRGEEQEYRRVEPG